jgi:hypothetical protein
MCGCTAFPPFCSKLTVKFVCVPFTIGVGVGYTITLRLPPLVALFIAAAYAIAYADDYVNKISKILVIKTNAIMVLFI